MRRIASLTAFWLLGVTFILAEESRDLSNACRAQAILGADVWSQALRIENFPPRIPSEGNQSADISSYDPIGRFVYVQAKYNFNAGRFQSAGPPSLVVGNAHSFADPISTRG